MTILTALNSMVDNPETKNETTANAYTPAPNKQEKPSDSSDANGYLETLNGIIQRIEAIGGNWQDTLRAFTGSDVPNEEISTTTKQNVLRRLQAELDDLQKAE